MASANPSYKLASIPRYDYIVRTLGGVCARCWPVTGRRRGGGVLNITAAACWRSGNTTRTQNVSEYMLVLTLCLVYVLVKAAFRLLSINISKLSHIQ